MTRDELKEKVARAIASRLETEGYVIRDDDGEVFGDRYAGSWQRLHITPLAEAALSAIEDASMAVVPVEPDDERLADLPEHPVEAMHRAWRTTRPSGVCGQTMDAVWRNKYAREMVAYRAMIEAGRVR